MPDEIDFRPEGGEELLAAGAPEPRRGTTASGKLRLFARVPNRAWGVLAIVAVLVAALVDTTQHRAEHAPSPAAQHPSASSAARPVPPPAPDPTAAALDRIAYLAGAPGLRNNLRGAGTRPTCPEIPIGDVPAEAVGRVLHRRLPGFAVLDSSVTMNADATLCGLDVRARDARGETLVVLIVAPPHGTGPGFTAQRRSDRTALRDVRVVTDGWQVEVGWVGLGGTGPSYATLAALARDPGLRW